MAKGTPYMAGFVIVVDYCGWVATNNALRLLFSFPEPLVLVLRDIPTGIGLQLPILFVPLVRALPAKGRQATLVPLVQLEIRLVVRLVRAAHVTALASVGRNLLFSRQSSFLYRC